MSYIFDVEIVIPTFQESNWIGETLMDLRSQCNEFRNGVEIVVVDENSNDGTAEIAFDNADQVISTPKSGNRSISRARNIGARASEKSLIFHTDADVRVPDLRALLIRVDMEFSDPSTVAMTVKLMPYPWDSTPLDRLIHRLANRYFEASFGHGAYFSRGECQIVRRSTFDLIGGYREDLISGEDCDLFRRISKYGRVQFVSDLVVYHSTRRFRKLGYLTVLAVYAREASWMKLFDRSYTKNWRVVR